MSTTTPTPCTVEVTIGWTMPDPTTDYRPMSDGYRPGAAQHAETVGVPLPGPADLTPHEVVTTIAEAVFVATNSPNPTDLAAEIQWQIAGTGYRGLEAGHYSLSVGDTVTIAETMLACTAVGWRRITATPVTSGGVPSRHGPAAASRPAGGAR